LDHLKVLLLGCRYFQIYRWLMGWLCFLIWPLSCLMFWNFLTWHQLRGLLGFIKDIDSILYFRNLVFSIKFKTIILFVFFAWSWKLLWYSHIYWDTIIFLHIINYFQLFHSVYRFSMIFIGFFHITRIEKLWVFFIWIRWMFWLVTILVIYRHNTSFWYLLTNW